MGSQGQAAPSLRHTTHPLRRALVLAAQASASTLLPPHLAEQRAQLVVDELLFAEQLAPELAAIDAGVRAALHADDGETTETAAVRVMRELTEARQQLEDHVAEQADRWRQEHGIELQPAPDWEEQVVEGARAAGADRVLDVILTEAITDDQIRELRAAAANAPQFPNTPTVQLCDVALGLEVDTAMTAQEARGVCTRLYWRLTRAEKGHPSRFESPCGDVSCHRCRSRRPEPAKTPPTVTVNVDRERGHACVAVYPAGSTSGLGAHMNVENARRFGEAWAAAIACVEAGGAFSSVRIDIPEGDL